MFNKIRLRNKILFPIALVIMGVSVAMLALLLPQLNHLVKKEAKVITEQMAYRYARETQVKMEKALGTASTLAQTFTGIKLSKLNLTRSMTIDILRTVMDSSYFRGVWCVWEPQAYDGQDELFAGKPGSSKSGRFIPYLVRQNNKINLITCPDYDSQGPKGNYYRIPLNTGKDYVTEPIPYDVQGQKTMMVSVSSPIYIQGKVQGVVGVDFFLDDFQKFIDSVRPLHQGYGFILSNMGNIIAHPSSDYLGQNIVDAWNYEQSDVLEFIKKGEKFTTIFTSPHKKEKSYYTFIPFTLGTLAKPWSFAVSVPMQAINHDAKPIILWVVATGISGFIILIVVIFWISRRIVRPLDTIVESCQDLAQGNFKRRISVASSDEFGKTALYINRAFDIVVEKMFWFENMLDAIPFPVYVMNKDMRWTFINKEGQELLGFSKVEAIGKACKLWDADICETSQCAVQILRNGGNETLVSIPGSDKVFKLTAAWLYNQSGSCTGHIEVIQDITEAQQLEQQASSKNWLRSGEAKLARILRGNKELLEITEECIRFICQRLNANMGAFYVKDGEELKLVASYAYTRRSDLSASFELGEGIIGQAALEKNLIILTEAPHDYVQIRSGLGSRKPVNIAILPCTVDGEVRAVLELASFSVFTELQQEFLGLIADSIAISINMIQANVRMKILLEKTKSQAETLRKHQKELRISNRDLEKQTKALLDSEAKLQAQQEELRQTNEELEQQAKALQDSELRLQNQQSELWATNEELENRSKALEKERDIVDGKNRELEKTRDELSRKARDLEITSKYKSEFMANMSHELRTPLNSILILSQLLFQNQSQGLSDKQKEFAKTIHSAGSDLLNLINDILDLSKVEAGKLTLHLEDISLQDIKQEVEDLFSPLAGKKKIKFVQSIDSQVPGKLHTDKQRLHQVLRNLLANAFKFTDKGRVELNIFLPEPGTDLSRSGLKPEQSIAFQVLDTGIGIPADKQQTIFEAFQQADGTTSRKYGGTGLGLSISREFAKLLRGELQLQSQPGQGSVFTLYLPWEYEASTSSEDLSPVVMDIKAAEKTSFVRDDRSSLKQGEKCLLIIEDDLVFAEVLRDHARRKGYKVLVAEDGELGLHFADLYRPSAIILDIVLPGMDGWTVLERLKSDPATSKIPVHFMSANDQFLDAMKIGAVGFMSKPISMNQLEQAFEHISSLKQDVIKKVLIVEDDEAQRMSILQLIQSSEVHSKAVSSGKEAFSILEKEYFDCIILDLGLYDMYGYDLLSSIRNDPELSKIPVIVYTGRELSDEEEAKIQKYAESIIIKGVRSPERLVDEMSLFLHKVEDEINDNIIISEENVERDKIFEDKIILIVDDDMRNVFALGSILEEKGVNVIEARNGKEALQRLEQNQNIDLILMDIMMPEMDGYQTISKIREDSKYTKLPIIALTAKAMRGDRAKCIEVGANEYLAKPVQAEKLFSLLRVWLF